MKPKMHLKMYPCNNLYIWPNVTARPILELTKSWDLGQNLPICSGCYVYIRKNYAALQKRPSHDHLQGQDGRLKDDT